MPVDRDYYSRLLKLFNTLLRRHYIHPVRLTLREEGGGGMYGWYNVETREIVLCTHTIEDNEHAREALLHEYVHVLTHHMEKDKHGYCFHTKFRELCNEFGVDARSKRLIMR